MTRAKGSDRVYVYIYNTDTREGLLSHPAERRQGRMQMQLPEGWNHQNIRMWGFVVDGEGRVSGSQYVAMSMRPLGGVAAAGLDAFAGAVGEFHFAEAECEAEGDVAGGVLGDAGGGVVGVDG